jgi:hypothetical protein
MTLPGAWYHVINRGIERRVIYPGEVYYQKFEELLGQTVQQFGIRIHSYVLMANHYHLQIETPREKFEQGGEMVKLELRGVVQPQAEAGWNVVPGTLQSDDPRSQGGGSEYSGIYPP